MEHPREALAEPRALSRVMTMTNEVLGLGRKICGTFGTTLAEVVYPEVVRVLHRGITYLERLRTCARKLQALE